MFFARGFPNVSRRRQRYQHARHLLAMLIKIKVPSNKHQTLPEIPLNTAITSPPIGSSAPGPQLIIDKLSITIKPASKDDAYSIHCAVYTAINDTSVFQSPKKKGGQFQVVHEIALTTSAERVRFEYAHEAGLAVLCRLELNPSKLGEMGLAGLHSVLASIMPNGWAYVIEHGRVTRIDLAADIQGLRMNQFLFMPHQGLTTSHVFGVNGHLETMYFGKPKGNQTRVYSKKKEQLVKGHAFCGPSVVRVERMLRNPKIVALKNLDQLDNPFVSMVMTIPLPGPPPGEKPNRWAMFEDSIKVRGLAAALALLPEDRRTMYRKHLKTQAHLMWDPAAIWSQWPGLLKDLCLIDPSKYP